jgi:hypothetical protein
MVMIHLNPCTKTYSVSVDGRFFQKGRRRREDASNTRQEGGAGLSSPPLCLSKILWFRQNFLPLRAGDPVKYAVHGFLDSGTGPMELPRGLGGKLTKHIPIPQSL